MSQRQRKKSPELTGKSRMSAFYYVLGLVAVVGIGVVGYAVGSKAFGSTASEPVDLKVANDKELVQKAKGVEQGYSTAPLTLVEFGDYECPGCGAFASQVQPLIIQDLVKSGKVKFVFYDFPLVQIHKNSFLAARAAHCAGDQQKFWEFHDALYRHQGAWSEQKDPTDQFDQYASQLGLDADAFDSCVKSDRHAETVTAHLRLGEALGVNGTPTLMLSQGKGTALRLGNVDYPSIRKTVDDELAKMAPDSASKGS